MKTIKNIASLLSQGVNLGQTVALATGLAITSSVLATHSAQAFVLTNQLTGDPRPDNPDELFVNVKIEVGENGLAANQAKWTIDIDSPFHSQIKLDQFFFNLSDFIKNDVTFSNFNLTQWQISDSADNAQGSGGADFDFRVFKQGSGGQGKVTNEQDLTFIMTAANALKEADFSNGSFASSSDELLGSFQMGAHLQSLRAAQGESDSGFAAGNYQENESSGGRSRRVPEPSTLAGLGLVAAALAGAGRSQSH